jgi:hypothetical protein
LESTPPSIPPSTPQGSQSEKGDTDGSGFFKGNEKLLAIIFLIVIFVIIACVAGFVIYNRRTKSTSMAS